MKSFEVAFYRKLEEDNAAGTGGVFGDADSMGYGGAITPAEDFWNPDDTRKAMGGKKKDEEKKKKKKKKKDGSIEVLIPLQRRPFNTA